LDKVQEELSELKTEVSKVTSIKQQKSLEIYYSR